MHGWFGRCGAGWRREAVVFAVAAVALAGCATAPSRALALRELARSSRLSWADRWKAAKDAGSPGSLIPLAVEYFREHEDAVGPDEVRRAAAADVLSLLLAPTATSQLLHQAERWAEVEMQDQHLADRVVCRGAELQPDDLDLVMRCADRAPWTRARELLLHAATLPGADRCAVVAIFDRRSQAPEVELRDFGAAEVRRCRLTTPEAAAPRTEPAAAAVAVAAPPPGSSPAGTEPRPAFAPLVTEEGRPLAPGFQLEAELSAGLFSSGVGGSIAWGSQRVAVGLTPRVSWLSVGGQSSLGDLTVSAWVKVYFSPRRAHGLTGFLLIEAGVETPLASGVAGGADSSPSFLGRLAGGAEYLFSPQLGLFGTLGLRGVLGGTIQGLDLAGSLGVTFHP